MTFGVFGTACFLAYLWATYIVPETANVSLEMIDEPFRSPASQEDMLVKRQVSYASSIFTIHSFVSPVFWKVEREIGLHDLMRGLSEENDELASSVEGTDRDRGDESAEARVRTW